MQTEVQATNAKEPELAKELQRLAKLQHTSISAEMQVMVLNANFMDFTGKGLAQLFKPEQRLLPGADSIHFADMQGCSVPPASWLMLRPM